MVDRQLSPATNNNMTDSKVTVVDLDGTYLTCNSLRLYLKVALKYSLRNLRIDRLSEIFLLYLLRKLRLISHETMKYKSIRLGGKSPRMLHEFSVEAHNAVNKKVKTFLDERQKRGESVLLATAAAESYVPLIWDGEYIASPMGGPDCRGIRKRDAVIRWASGRRLSISFFLTDHHEDLPLAEYVIDNGGKVILVNPSSETLEAFPAGTPVGVAKFIPSCDGCPEEISRVVGKQL